MFLFYSEKLTLKIERLTAYLNNFIYNIYLLYIFIYIYIIIFNAIPYFINLWETNFPNTVLLQVELSCFNHFPLDLWHFGLTDVLSLKIYWNKVYCHLPWNLLSMVLFPWSFIINFLLSSLTDYVLSLFYGVWGFLPLSAFIPLAPYFLERHIFWVFHLVVKLPSIKNFTEMEG